MIDSDALAGCPTINLGTTMTAYQPFSVKTSTSTAGDPQNPTASGDVTGVVDVSGRRGILKTSFMAFRGRVSLPALNNASRGDAIYVNVATPTVFVRAAAGSQVAVLLEAYNNNTASPVTVNLLMMWV
jgi:hypothetical protein